MRQGDHATNMPATVWFGSGSLIKDSIKYKYDSCGNICEISESGHLMVIYTYDSLNRLIREDNRAIGKTSVYTYDQNGNIIERCEYTYTSKSGEELFELDCKHDSFDYDGDKLVNYNGETFTYNSLGNPTTYRGKAVEWQYGTRLSKFDETTFTYDGLGRRTSKNGIKFTYDNDGRLLKQSNGLEFIYDNAGVVGVKYDGTQYFYRKDAQGNIIAILDSNGEVVVKYVYDAWGNHAVIDNDGSDVEDGIGALNPFRYRGYYYDTETGLYYLQTRYYDPELGRFISQDSIEYADPETINGLNLYAYCGNNPITNVDPTGNAWWDILAWIGLAIVVVAAAVLTAGAAGAVIGGVAGGIIYGAAIGAIGLGVVGAAGGAIGGMIYDAAVGNSFGTSIWTGVKAGFGIGAIAGAIIGGAIGGAAAYSVTGLTNASFWTGLGENGAQIAANAAGQEGLTTIGQTFGGKLVQGLTNIFGYKATKFLWVSLSKTMASTVAMSSVTVFTGTTISATSVFALIENPILLERGIEIIRKIIGG